MSAARSSPSRGSWRCSTPRRHGPGWINSCELIGFVIGMPLMSLCRGVDERRRRKDMDSCQAVSGPYPGPNPILSGTDVELAQFSRYIAEP